MSGTETEVKEKIHNFIKNNFMIMGGDSIVEEDSLMEKGIVDSTGVLEVINFLQSDFGIIVADEEMLPENLDSIAKIAAYINRKSVS
jgi:acyl carrier protein